ncbi:flagellar hook protein [Acidobacteria bacterium AB60]|nr:flagellar hook protein [Acidobacteria bacterium AB60]
MGTVGLNFGSPTSGQGFDVTATVSQIVTNLQKVETPWKNQLTALQSQDTALSNLGTLLSTVSTDLSSLTDFSGVMAQKTGSSSDNNVLELTSASSSAIAGTHTIAVASLAKTSSGYLTALADPSDELSGSVKIQVGAGVVHTINVSPANKTLGGLAAAINAAGIGVTASVLTDASGSRLSLVSGTSGALGNLRVTSSLADVTTPTASLAYKSVVTGIDAVLNVDGVDLKSASNTVTGLIPGLTFQLLAPSATIADGSLEVVQVVIGNDNSGVEAAVSKLVSDYNALIGAINTQQGRDASGDPEPLFGSPTLSLLHQQLMTAANLQNPNGYLNAVAQDATLSGSITIRVGTATAQTINVPESDTSVAGLAEAINAANMGVTAVVVTRNGESSITLQSQTAGPAGSLDVQSNLTATSDSISTSLNYTSSSNLSTLANLGSSVSAKDDGTLTFDQSTLDAALNSNFSGVLGFFQNAYSWGQTVSNILNSAGTKSSTGILSLAQKSNSSIESSLKKQISKQEASIADQQKRLTAELNQANQILQALPNQLNGMEMLYAAITGYNQKG